MAIMNETQLRRIIREEITKVRKPRLTKLQKVEREERWDQLAYKDIAEKVDQILGGRKLKPIDQFVSYSKNGEIGSYSLTRALVDACGMPHNKMQGAKDFYFDDVNLVDAKTGEDILQNALLGHYTFNELVSELKLYFVNH
jgi:hypothetical protein